MRRLIPLLAAAGLAWLGFQLPARAQTQEELARRQYDGALRFLNQQRYDDALKDLRAVVESYPSSTVADDALLRIAEYLFEIADDPAQAQTVAEQLVQRYPSSDSAPGGLIVAGRILLAGSRAPKDLSNALAQFERVSQIYPRSATIPEALFWQGETQRLNNQTADALLRFGRLNADYPDSTPWTVRSLLGTALCAVALEQPQTAMVALQRLRLRFPRSPEAERAIAWNTQLYRLYVRPPQDPPYRFSGRALTGPTPKLRDVSALATDLKDGLFAISRDTLVAFNLDGTLMRAPPTLQPRGLLLDRHGALVILQKGSLKPANAGAMPLTTVKPDGTLRIIEDPTAAVSLSTGEFLVADPSTRSVLKFTPQGKLLGTLAPERPARLVVNGLDEIAALNKDEKRVSVINREGKIVRQLGPRSAEFEFRNPVDLAYDPLGHLFVLDRGRGAIFIFGPTGKLRATLTIAENTAGALRESTSMALDSSGRLFIYDQATERIQIYQ